MGGMTELEKRNLYTGILGTVAVHLFALFVLLMVKFDKVKTEHKEKIVIEFADEVEQKSIEEIIEEKPELKEVPVLDQEELKNIAVNTAEKFDDEISTEKFEQEIMKELGMLDDEPEEDVLDAGDIAMQNEHPEEKDEKDPEQFKGKTRIEYFLENRKHRYLYRPIYKCQSGGTVVIDIVVNQKGEVVSASVKEANTNEHCVLQTALEASRATTFNTDYNAEARQKGTIKYIFTAQ